MQTFLGNLLDADEGDAGSLFDGEWVIGWFEFDVWALADWAGVGTVDSGLWAGNRGQKLRTERAFGVLLEEVHG